jgi:hypothetical protein
MEDNRRVNPKALLFFLKSILAKLEQKNFSWDDTDLISTVVVIMTSEWTIYPYKTIMLVEKHLSKHGWNCKMTNFTRGTVSTYTWRFTRQDKK